MNMKIRQWGLGLAFFMLIMGPSWAVNTVTNTNSNTNNMQGVGNTSFNFSNETTTISQSNTDNVFCQFFSFSSPMMSFWQIIQGNTMTQGSGLGVTDPCQ